MAAAKMHADEADIDVPLVRRLLAAQFPQWAGLPVERVASSGTDNAIYRLGADLAVRLPRISWALGQVEKDQRWLPRLGRGWALSVALIQLPYYLHTNPALVASSRRAARNEAS
jgi:aminoglycoside phosphotransferase (APT) family kinase protein